MVDINSHMWVAHYTDGSCDVEGQGVKFHELKFPLIERFQVLPLRNAERQVALEVIKDPDSLLIFRKQQHVRVVSGAHVGTDYLVGLDPDNGDLTASLVEMGFEDPSVISRSNPGPFFRVWLLRDGSIATSGTFHRETRVVGGVKVVTFRLSI